MAMQGSRALSIAIPQIVSFVRSRTGCMAFTSDSAFNVLLSRNPKPPTLTAVRRATHRGMAKVLGGQSRRSSDGPSQNIGSCAITSGHCSRESSPTKIEGDASTFRPAYSAPEAHYFGARDHFGSNSGVFEYGKKHAVQVEILIGSKVVYGRKRPRPTTTPSV